MAEKQRHHFLFITSSHQSHIKPTFHLTKHLVTSTGAAVTFSTTVFAHRRMFSSTTNSNQDLITDGLITFIPYSDGYDDGYKSDPSIFTEKFHSYLRTNSKRSVSELVENLAGRGQPVTCIIYSIGLNWAVEVAGDHDIRPVLYWIQSASVFATYYHFFHGFESLIKAHIDDLSFTVSFPGLQPLQIRDLPSFLGVIDHDSADGSVLCLFRELFEILDEVEERDMKKPIVLMNTFQEWETDALDLLITSS